MSDPPYMEKNKLLFNEYLGDFMHFETLFFFFLVWKWVWPHSYGGGLTLRIFLSSRFWFVLYQRLFLGKLPWGNPLDHFGNCSTSSAGGRRPPTLLRSANDPTPSGPRLITSIKPTSEWEYLLTDRISWKVFFHFEWKKFFLLKMV